MSVTGFLLLLVVLLLSVDGFSAGSVAAGEVSSLAHEGRDHTVECTALVAKALLAGAKGTEVL